MEDLEKYTKEKLIQEIEILQKKTADLEESEKRYRLFFENNDSIILFINPENGNIEFANKTAERYYGYSNDQLISMNINRINTLPPEEIKLKMANAKKRKQNYFVFKHRLASGEIRDVEVYQTKLFLNKKELFSIIVHDITDRKDIEQALNKSEKKYRSVLENIQLVGLMLDKNANIIFINDYLLKITGWKREEVLEKNWFDYFIPDELAHDVKKVFKKTIELGEMPLHYVNDIKTKKLDLLRINWSNTTHLDENNKPISVTSIGEDITEKIKAETELKLSEEKYRQLIETASDAIYLMSDDGKIIDTNRCACDMLGRTKEELLKLTIHDVDPSFPLQDFLDFWQSTPYNEQRIFETRHQKKDGTLIPIEISGTKYKIDNKDYYYGIARDITERKKSEKDLIENEEKFRTLITSMNDLVFVFDENKRFTYYHAPNSESLILEPDDFLDKTISEVMPASINELFDKAFSVVKKGKAHRFEYFLEIQGEIEWYSMQLSPMYKDDKFSGAIAVARNITENKKTEEDLKKHRVKLEELVKERTVELQKTLQEVQRMNELFVGREFRIKELKDEIEFLKTKQK